MMAKKRFNRKLNEKIREMINMYTGTVFGERLRNAYQGGMSYEGLCAMCNLDPADYGVDTEAEWT